MNTSSQTTTILPPGYAAYLVFVTAGGYHEGTEICLNLWLLMIINNMHWGHLMFKVCWGGGVLVRVSVCVYIFALASADVCVCV